MKSSHSIKMVNIFFLVLALSFSYKSFAGLIDFETTANGSTPFDNGIINIDDTFMADGLALTQTVMVKLIVMAYSKA